MGDLKQIGVKFSSEDVALAEAIRQKTGISNRADVIRLALRRLAQSEGVVWPPPVAISLVK
jgi:Arc/MetJ-type ribon-helix-helix transcriptional regulator